MRFASTSEILDYVRSHPDCVTADIVEEFYPRSTTLPSDRVAGRDGINTKLGGLRRRQWIVNLNPGRQNTAVWRAIA